MTSRFLISLAAMSLIAACGQSAPTAPKSPTPAAGGAEAPAAAGTKAVDPGKPAAAAAAPAVKAAADKKAAAAPAGERLEGWIAKVNGVEITAGAFYQDLDKITARGAKIPADRLARIQQNILKRLIEKELIKQAVSKAGVTIGDKEIEAAFVEYKKRFQTEEQFDNYLKHGRVTLDSIKARITEKKALEKLIEAKGNLEIGDKELQEFYAKNERFYIEKAGVKASHILVKVAEKAKAEDEKRALDKVKQVRKELKAGGDFAELAKKFSEGPSAPKGGDLGFFGQGQMVKDFEEVAFKMKVGEISGPVRTRFGFHIIKVIDKREERKKPFKEVKEQISQSLKNKKFFQERRKLLETLRKEAKVEKRLEDPKPAAAPKKPVTIDKAKGAKLVPTKAAAPKAGAKPAAAPTK
ncbi:MAG: peptidylprolyl isomerase [Myxococcota bacterium]